MQLNCIKKLKGYSGCPLYILNAQGRLIVRKISASRDYNARLKKQCLKQAEFFKDKEGITAPNIFSEGYTKHELYYFDMEYIKGQTFSNYLQTCSIDDFLGRLKLLVNWSMLSKTDLTNKGEVRDIFLNKIDQLKSKNTNLKGSEKIFKFMNQVPWERVPRSVCHGDLTIQNILIYQDKIYLLDFLDSFYDSWMIDIAKLLQDLDLGWTFRYEDLSMETKLKMRIGTQYIIDTLNSLACEGAYRLVYSLLLLNILRITPYCKDNLTYDWIERSCDYLLTESLK